MMKQLTGIGAAIAFAAVSMGAHAALTIDSGSSVTYAKETLLKTKTVDVADGGTHYTLAPDHEVAGKTSIYTTGTANDAYVIRYAFSGMVLAGIPSIAIMGGGTAPKTDETPIILGGFAGTNQVVFQVIKGDVKRTAAPNDDKDSPAEDPTITLTAEFAISGEGSGTITRVVQNRALRDLDIEEWSETKVLSGAVKALPALKEIVAAASDPIAHSAFDFMQFKPGNAATPRVSTSVGSIRLTVAGSTDKYYRDAQKEKVTQPSTDKPNTVVDTLEEVTGPDGSSPYDNSVTFSGNFTFVEKVGLSKSAVGCDGTISELRKPSKADSTVLTDEAKPQPAGDFETIAKHLCIQVDGKTTMPNTTPYQVTTDYKGILNAAFPPEGGTYDLARIVRDGTTYYLPYLTTYSGYNQRISIVNRGKATTYSLIELASEDGVTVSAKPQASGDLPQGQTVLRASDLVEIEDGTRASGTLTIVADYGVISASLQQVNKADGAIDTVILAHGAATY